MLLLVPATSKGFRAAVSAQQSLDGKTSVSFHTSIPEDRCVRLLIKSIGKSMPERVVLEELRSL
jgi:hypothetical protein